MAIGDSCISFSDFYFVLISLPDYGEWVHVDVKEGTRDYEVLKMMRGSSHIYLAEEDGFIHKISIAPGGQKFLERAGHKFKGHEESLLEEIKNLTEDWEIKHGLREDTTEYIDPSEYLKDAQTVISTHDYMSGKLWKGVEVPPPLVEKIRKEYFNGVQYTFVDTAIIDKMLKNHKNK